MEYQHRYVEYSKEHGRSPEAMLAADKERWPGACMCGFICWINDRWTEFSNNFKRDRHMHLPQDHVDFDAWLTERNKSKLPIDQLDLLDETINA